MEIEIGDRVKFIGLRNPSTDCYTKKLTERNLEYNKIYTIYDICYRNIASLTGWSEDHYRLEPNGGGFWYPSSCFVLDKSYFIKKYNLR